MSEYNINTQYTLLERAKTSLDGKSVVEAVDVMDKMGVDSFVKDVPFYEANMGLKHRVSRTTDRPHAERRKFYAGTAKKRATTQLVWEPVCLFETQTGVDEDEIDTIVNGTEARAGIDKPVAAGILDDFVYAMYNDSRASGGEYIDGLGARMGTLSSPESGTGALPYVWDNGGAAATGSLCSLWIVEYGPRAVHGLYPSGQLVRGTGPLGMSIRNKGKVEVTDPDDSTKTYWEYKTQFKFWWGLCVVDDWKIARIANINRSASGSGALDDNVIVKALNHGKFNEGATRIYANPWLTSQIEIRAKDKSNAYWDVMEVFGRKVPAIRGIPLRKVDDTILSATETAITT
jgi:hypothetical protein